MIGTGILEFIFSCGGGGPPVTGVPVIPGEGPRTECLIGGDATVSCVGGSNFAGGWEGPCLLGQDPGDLEDELNLRCFDGGDPILRDEDRCEFGNAAGGNTDPCQSGTSPNDPDPTACITGTTFGISPEDWCSLGGQAVGGTPTCEIGSDPRDSQLVPVCQGGSAVERLSDWYEKNPACSPGGYPGGWMTNCNNGYRPTGVTTCNYGSNPQADLSVYHDCNPGSGFTQLYACSLGSSPTVPQSGDLCFQGNRPNRDPTDPSDIRSGSQAQAMLDEMTNIINRGWIAIDAGRRAFLGHSRRHGFSESTGLYAIKERLEQALAYLNYYEVGEYILTADDRTLIRNVLERAIFNYLLSEAGAREAHIQNMHTAIDSYWTQWATTIWPRYNAESWAMRIGAMGGAGRISGSDAQSWLQGARGLFDFSTPPTPSATQCAAGTGALGGYQGRYCSAGGQPTQAQGRCNPGSGGWSE